MVTLEWAAHPCTKRVKVMKSAVKVTATTLKIVAGTWFVVLGVTTALVAGGAHGTYVPYLDWPLKLLVRLAGHS